jgi:tRNA (mo5U34)-methyltransferase
LGTKEELLNEITSGPPWYHTIELWDDQVTPGIYDHRPLLKLYGIPQQLHGWRVLDVGASNGFFSFEFEKRGAREVVALDLKDWRQHDFLPDALDELNRMEHFADRWERNSKVRFDLLKSLFNSQVRKVEMSIYEISPATLGTFDLVFCSSVLMHLMNPILALAYMRAVTRKLAIVCTAVDPTLESSQSLARYANSDDRTLWWIPNANCLQSILHSVGFAKVHQEATFSLRRRASDFATPHAIFHAE